MSKRVFIFKYLPYFFTHIRKIIIHSQVIPTYYEINVRHDFDFVEEYNPKNYTFSVIRSSRQYLGSPYGQCSDYRDSDSKSRQQCYRKCFRDNYVKNKHCIPLFIDHFISELDSIPNSTQLCLKKDTEFEPKLIEKCKDLCPKECLRVEYYYYKITESDWKVGITRDILLRREREEKEELFQLFQSIDWKFKWDSSEPMFVYTEEPVMSLSDYLVNCGGLMGLWFGTSAKDIITFIIESQFVKKLTRLVNYTI